MGVTEEARRCVADEKLIWWRRCLPNNGTCQIYPRQWVCSYRCYRTVASAIDIGFGHVYLNDAA